ncbi:MAG: bifunctional DNase/RNase [Sphingobacteriales bacterium]|jgi:bifunctional DNase/RNase
MDKIKLEIVGLSYSQTQSGAYALVLGESKGKRRLPIIIGGFEAQAIAIEIEKMKPSRPLTHDLFKSLTEAFKIDLKEVIIYNLVDGIFYAKLICSDGENEVEIDARTSDAIALAVRYECDVFTYEFILSQAGIMIEGNDFVFLENLENKDSDEDGDEDEIEEIQNEPKKSKALNSLSDSDLKKQLDEALRDEAYELAAKIRDELSKRQ